MRLLVLVGRFIFILFAAFLVGVIFSVILDAIAGRPLSTTSGYAICKPVEIEGKYCMECSSRSEITGSVWAAIADTFVRSGDIDGAIAVIKELPRERERLVAIGYLLARLRPVVVVPTVDATAPRIENKAEIVARIRKVHEYLDTLSPSAERLQLYATLTDQYADLGDSALAQTTREHLKKEVEAVAKVNWLSRAWEWVADQFTENVGRYFLGLIAIVLFFLRPTFEVWAKALMFRCYGRSESEYIKKALPK